MKALVLTEYLRLEYADVPAPVPGPDDVLVRVKACGICGSDVHGFDGGTGRRIPPVIMGHEAAGTVEAAGAAAGAWRPGDRVTFDSTVYCGACPFCRTGRINLCDDRRVLGVSCREYRRDGAFAEFVAVPQRILHRLPDGVSFVHAAMTEPLSVAFHAVRRLPVAFDDAAVVVGAGMIGLLALQVLAQAGCRVVAAVDIDESRRDRALALGAAAAVAPEQAEAAVRAATRGRGADIVVEAVGAAGTVALAAALARKGGAVALIGNVTPEVPLPLQAVVTRELTLAGSCASAGEYPACLDLIARGAVRLDPLLSAAAPLAEGAAWFARLREGAEGLMKVVLVP
ncbi:MAG TPA: galactitol-1-phosphate 5-dehydrogenase [Planctomycetes bacterium]|nr:galactitol-1-phosphate 5-dehydrogenase [Planctomycetota bacterium]